MKCEKIREVSYNNTTVLNSRLDAGYSFATNFKSPVQRIKADPDSACFSIL